MFNDLSTTACEASAQKQDLNGASDKHGVDSVSWTMPTVCSPSVAVRL